MPGLPRKSTAKQFKKLMGKSGKSRTNRSSGGVDPSRKKISTYEQFISLLEGNIIWYNDDGTIEEEPGYDDVEEFDVVKPEDVRIGLKLWTVINTKILDLNKKLTYFGEIINIREGDNQITIYGTSKTTFIFPFEKFLSYKFLKKMTLSENRFGTIR
jgi:hypothetical protein